MTSSVIDTSAKLVSALDKLATLPARIPSLFVDLEGEKLSRTGTLTIITIFVEPHNHVYIFDVLLLKDAAFSTAGATGNTLKQILESPSIPKVFFDVRNDSDALFHHHKIALQGVQDVQLMELASRPGTLWQKKYLNGLAICIDREGGLNVVEKAAWKTTKAKITTLMNAKGENETHLFAHRPLSPDAIEYCIGDVCILPRLRTIYRTRLTKDWKAKVKRAVLARVEASQSPEYVPHGDHKRFGPW